MTVYQKCEHNVFGDADVCSFCGTPVAASAPKSEPSSPFDPRREVSADARHIVKHLWILFVLFPIIAALLWGLVDATK